jgi:transcriptional repressor NrdR
VDVLWTTRAGVDRVRCPFCGRDDSRVLDSRPTDDGAVIRRRRECGACGERFTTYEKVESMQFVVVKKDGRREAWSQEKVLRGLMTACEKRPVQIETLERLVRDVERELRSRSEREVASREIGELVTERLREVDQVAYVRFASVYRQFQDVRRFKEELERLMEAGRLDVAPGAAEADPRRPRGRRAAGSGAADEEGAGPRA